VVSSGKLLYLGYVDEGDSNPTNGDTSPKDKSSSDSKSAIDRSTSTTSDNDSTGKKTSSAKLDRADSTKNESSFKKDKSSSFDSKSSRHTNDGTDSLSSSDLASTFRNNEGRHNLFGFSDHGF
jgi:hypothetical protein